MLEKFGSQITTLIMDSPMPLAIIVVAVIVATWWLRSYIGKERIATLEERLRLARDEQNIVTRQVEILKPQIAELERQIGQQNTPALAGVTGAFRDLSTANSVLGSTLAIAGPHGRAMTEWRRKNSE
jgi:hypothetical protein